MSSMDPRFDRWMKVQAYKHDGLLHRQWSPAFLVQETQDYWALASKGSSVTESDGRKWMTREHAIFLLFKKRWMNVIAMFKENGGICYYVNIATPTLLDQGYLKYIDYDLDVKLYPDMVERTLDEKEFERHVLTYGYPPDLTAAIEKSKKEVQEMIAKKEFPFVDSVIIALYQKFIDENKPILSKPQ
jgi:protein associated with RNAse G/E